MIRKDAAPVPPFFFFSLHLICLTVFHSQRVDSSSCVDFILGVLLEYIDQLQEVTRFDSDLFTLIVFTSMTIVFLPEVFNTLI